MLSRSSLPGVLAAAVLSIAGAAMAGPEAPGYYYEEEESYERHVTESAVPYVRPAPPPVAVYPAPEREKVEIHVHVSGCSPRPSRPVFVASPPPLPPPVPVVQEYRYEVRESRYVTPPPIAFRPVSSPPFAPGPFYRTAWY